MQDKPVLCPFCQKGRLIQQNKSGRKYFSCKANPSKSEIANGMVAGCGFETKQPVCPNHKDAWQPHVTINQFNQEADQIVNTTGDNTTVSIDNSNKYVDRKGMFP